MTRTGPSTEADELATGDVRPGRFQVGRLHRLGPVPSRMLLIASSRVVAAGERTGRRFDERLADRIRAVGGRGLDLDVLGEPRRVLAAIERNPTFWRMWRYDVLAVVLPRRARRSGSDAVVDAVLAEASERSRVVLVDGSGDEADAAARLAVDLGRRNGLESLAAAMSDAAGRAARLLPPDGLRARVPDPGTVARLQEVVHIARQAFGTASAIITLAAARELLVVAAEGADLGPVPRDAALCARTVRASGPTVFDDTWDDADARRLEGTHGPDGIRFYAGYPLRSADGEPIGTLCVYDPEPRPAEEHDWTLLRDLAMLAEAELGATA